MFSILKNTSQKASFLKKKEIYYLLILITVLLFLLSIKSDFYGPKNTSVELFSDTHSTKQYHLLFQFKKLKATNNFNVNSRNSHQVLIEENEEKLKKETYFKLLGTTKPWLISFYFIYTYKPCSNKNTVYKANVPSYIKHCSLKYFS